MAFKEYVAELQHNLKSGHATEPTYYPALKSLLESLDSSLSVLQNPKKTEHGSPDFRVVRKKTIDFPVGWIEAKEPGVALDKIEKGDQIKRYLHLPNLILTNFLEFRWYADGKPRFRATLGTESNGKLKVDVEGQTQVEELLRGFLAHKTPPAKDSRDLARRMAQLAHFIREAILIAYEAEKPDNILHLQMNAFREALIPDLTPEQFADMYAQTIAYGLFAARCQPPQPGEKFTREHAAYLIPKTNPFLRKLFGVIAGPDLPEQILPYVDDLVALLRDTDIDAIMAEWGKRTGKEDPVVHFYEDFLQAYDPKLRELRGVYYTPEPVVSYIVRSIDHILKTEFSKPLGLADKDVLILDPACGTGTFLYFVIRHIHDTLCQHGQKGQWNSYVSENLLKRVFGFELLMAPYAVAHLKLGLLLQELDYKFESDERLGVYLTNTLEEAAKKAQQIFAFADAIAEEARLAGDVKLNKKVMVVLGNPPYSGISANRGLWIDGLLKGKLPYGEVVPSYYEVDGAPLGEKKIWLQDDYVKFIRFGQWRIERTGHGVLSFVSNHGYLDNPTFRGMRQQLMHAFSEIWVLDLHGNVKKKEVAPNGVCDENVFDIKQGVAIGVLSKSEGTQDPASVMHTELWADRASKYKYLFKESIETSNYAKLTPTSPFYFFVPTDETNRKEYEMGWHINEALPVNASGIVTARDGFVMDFDPKSILDRISDIRSTDLSDEEIRTKYFQGKGAAKYAPGDSRGWKLPEARKKIRSDAYWNLRVVRCLYRPFDFRFLYYAPWMVDWPRYEVMGHLFNKKNIAIVTARSNKSSSTDHFFCSDSIVETKCGESTTQSITVPLYLYEIDEEAFKAQMTFTAVSAHHHPHPNFSKAFIKDIEQCIRIPFRDDAKGELLRAFGPEDVLGYIYAIFYSTKYRVRYRQFLKTDFPRIPLTTDKTLFAALAEKGGELISLHLMESPKLSHFITKYEQPGDHEVKKVRYAEPNPKAGIKSGRVYINDAQYFEAVPNEVWEFHIGGYQVCEKWLKDRRGRKLSSDDIDHYQKIVVALTETIRLMREIDEIIPGWPLP